MTRQEISINPFEESAIEKVVTRLYPEDLPFKNLIIELSRKKPLKAMYLLMRLAHESIVLECSLLVYYELRKMNYPRPKMSAIRLYRYFSSSFVGLKEAKDTIEYNIYQEETTLQHNG